MPIDKSGNIVLSNDTDNNTSLDVLLFNSYNPSSSQNNTENNK